MKYKHFLGVVLSINSNDFEKINGYPYKKFKGWGGEDDALRNRLLFNGIAYTKPPRGRVYDLEELNWKQKKEKLDRENQRMEKDEKARLVKLDYRDYNTDGVRNIPIDSRNTLIEDRTIGGRNVKWVLFSGVF